MSNPISKSFGSFFLFIALCFTSIGQDLPKNLIYANENLFFEDIVKVGEYKLLRITPQKRQNRRFIYLLNKQNIVSDTMKVFGNDRFLIRTDSTLSIRGLGENVDVEILNNQFHTTFGFNTQTDFTYNVIDPIFFIGKYLFGSSYIPDKDCLVYRTIRADSIEFLASVSISFPREYNFDDLDTVFLLSVKAMEKFTNGKDTYSDIHFNNTIPQSETCQDRVRHPYFGWNSYSIDGNDFFMYEKSNASLYQFGISGELKLKNKIEFPVKDRETEGWKYLFDQTAKKHYMAKRITQYDESKRKRKKKNTSYTYELYALDVASQKLKPLFKLGFEPKMIDDGLIYEIVAESKKGSAIYFHPIDPNYKYQKSKLIYSKEN